MAYKLIALDLDDTLLDYNKRISLENRNALKRAEQDGLHIILSSGRGFESVSLFSRELSLNEYTIVYGGAQVIDPSGNVVYVNCVPPIAAKQVMRWAALRGIHLQIYLDDGYYYMRHNQFSDAYEQDYGAPGHANPDLLSIENVLTAKILLIDTPEKIEEYRRELCALFPELSVQTSQSHLLEILHPETSKARALAFVADKLGIERQQIVAIGDSEIDLSMIEYAQLGIAVANAVPALLEVADYVTSSCDENGVAHAIEKCVLL